jgi:hypothetical protein
MIELGGLLIQLGAAIALISIYILFGIVRVLVWEGGRPLSEYLLAALLVLIGSLLAAGNIALGILARRLHFWVNFAAVGIAILLIIPLLLNTLAELFPDWGIPREPDPWEFLICFIYAGCLFYVIIGNLKLRRRMRLSQPE